MTQRLKQYVDLLQADNEKLRPKIQVTQGKLQELRGDLQVQHEIIERIDIKLTDMMDDLQAAADRKDRDPAYMTIHQRIREEMDQLRNTSQYTTACTAHANTTRLMQTHQTSLDENTKLYDANKAAIRSWHKDNGSHHQ